MSRHAIVGVAVAVISVIGGWALAQQDAATDDALLPTAAGPYAVSPTGKSAVLLDTRSGKTWILARPARRFKGRAVWLPIQRIDSRKKADEWRIYEYEAWRKRVREKAEAAIRKE